MVMNITINIDKIIDINENEGYFTVKWTMIRKWRNSQLTYQNLKRNPNKNKVSAEDEERMWTPWFLFENIQSTEDIKKTDQKHSVTIVPNQEFHFEMSDKTNFRNTRLFKGDENVIKGRRPN